jgi:hypothetical protein
MSILIFYSMSVSKLLSYTVPAFPFAAIVMAAYLESAILKRSVKLLALSFAALGTVYGAALLIAPLVVPKLRDCPPGLESILPGALFTLTLSAFLASLASFKGQIKIAVPFFTTMLLGTSAIFGWQAVQTLSANWEMPVKSFAQFAANSSWPIVVFQTRKPSVPFYAEKKVLITDEQSTLEKSMAENAHGYIIARDKNARLLQELGCKIIATEGNAILCSWNKH